jgi:prepilin-type N-terminal cleavage/methylation domain-containing protein/prepilin-type processing-associated H-X9-DG protein
MRCPVSVCCRVCIGRAFTLIELLVVVAIIALLISILLPSLAEARRQTRTVVCRSNLRQLGLGWIMYAHDSNGFLPGSTNDYMTFPNPTRTFCWLGTYNGGAGQDPNWVPRKGTIFPYVAEHEKIYKCPEDHLDPRAFNPTQNPPMRTKTLYSYTAPSILSGAPITLLNHTLFPADFPLNYKPDSEWKRYVRTTLPWMILEEDEACWLDFVFDSAWGNVDRLTTRHNGKASIAHTDGSVTNRKYQNSDNKDMIAPPGALVATMVYYDLTDGRRVNAGTWGSDLKFGYILKAGDMGN